MAEMRVHLSKLIFMVIWSGEGTFRSIVFLEATSNLIIREYYIQIE